jgi:hypothetical protein
MVEILAAYNSQDWTRLRAGLTEDLQVADHRPAPALYDGITGPDEFVAALQPLFDMASGVAVSTVAVHVVSPRAAVFQLSTLGVSAEGGEFELAFNLGYLVVAGKVSRLEFFADDHLTEARARLLELAGPNEG